MGQKCCRPKQRSDFPIYMILLSEAYADIKNLQSENTKLRKDLSQNQITHLLNKKGYVRKLCDYLSSHHHYICQSLKLILMQIRKKKTPYNLAASAEIALKILTMTQEKNTEPTEEEEHKNNQKSVVLKFYQQFEHVFFQICLELLEQYINLSKESDNSFLQTGSNIMQMLRGVSSTETSIKVHYHTIKKVLDALVEVINSKRKQQQSGLIAYRKIIQKYNISLMSANIYRDIVKQHLWKFLAYWVREISQNIRDGHENSKSKQQMQCEVNNIHIQAILLQFFNSIFSYQQSESIYKELMLVYDTLSFGHVLIEIEGLVFNSLQQFELKQQFLYRWFDYMLNYLAVTSNYYQNIWNISGFQYSYDSMKQKHKNILKEENAIGCLRTVQRWVKGGYIDIGTVLKFKSRKLLVAVLSNLSNSDNERQILRETCQTIEYLVNEDSFLYVELISHMYTIVEQLQIKEEEQDKSESQKRYFDRLLKILASLNPFKIVSEHYFASQKEEMYEKIYEVIFEKLQSSKTLITNRYLIKISTNVMEKIGLHYEHFAFEKLCFYLTSFVHLIQQMDDQYTLVSLLSEISSFLNILKKSGFYLLKAYLNYILGVYEKSPVQNIFHLLVEVYLLIQNPKNAEKILLQNKNEVKVSNQLLISQMKKLIKGRKSDQKSQAVQKLFDHMSKSIPEIILEDGDHNSIVSNQFATSSLGKNDHSFEDVLNCVNKA